MEFDFMVIFGPHLYLSKRKRGKRAGLCYMAFEVQITLQFTGKD